MKPRISAATAFLAALLVVPGMLLGCLLWDGPFGLLVFLQLWPILLAVACISWVLLACFVDPDAEGPTLPRFSLRTLLWLVVVAALACGWWADRSRLAKELGERTQRVEDLAEERAVRIMARSASPLETSGQRAPSRPVRPLGHPAR